MALLTALDIADDAGVWTDLGFAVDAGSAWISGVEHRLGQGAAPVGTWTLFGVTGVTDIDGIATTVVDDPASDPPDHEHPNGVTGLDHLVVATPDVDRTVAALEKVGLRLLRIRETDRVKQGFFRLGPVIVEVAGGREPRGDGPASLMGLAWTCADLDATVRFLGSRLHPAKDAVQEGRRIATLDKSAGSQAPMAFMSG